MRLVVMLERSPIRCPHCPALAGARCKGQEIRRLCELVDPTSTAYNPGYKALLSRGPDAVPARHASEGADEAPNLSETLMLLRLMKECPDRIARTNCGCAGLAQCGRGKGRQGLVNNLDCFECLRAERGRAAGPA